MNINYANYDIYSNRIGFFFNDKEKIGTFFGLFLTILYISISIIFLVIYIILTINRQNMTVYDSTTYSKDLPFIEINPNLIYFAFGLENQNTSNRFINETIYYPKILFFDETKVKGEFNITQRRELEYEICQKENFGKDYNKFFSDGELNNSYCLKNFNLTLKGGYKYDKMSYLKIKIYPCKNSTENNNHCQPQDIIDSYLKGGYFSILTKDIELDPSNYSFPVVPTLQSLYITIDKSMNKEYTIYYGITEIKTDTNLFTAKIKTEKYIQFRKQVESFNIREEDKYYDGKVVCSIDLKLDDLIHTQKRSYTKMTEIFPIIGGYMQLINTIFSLLSILSNRLIPELKILNGIFNFNFKEKKIAMKVSSIKDFNSQVNKKNLFFQSDNEIYNFKNKIHNNNINRYSLKVSYNKNSSNNNLSKNSLIGPDNNNENNSSVVNIINRKHNSLIVIKERENEKSNNSNNNLNNSSYNAKSPSNNDKKIQMKHYNNNNSNANGNKNYIFRVGSFYPNAKLKNTENNKKNNSLQEYVEQINFNLFEYYCCGKFTKKKKDIELYKLGLSLYKNRMDIINVFTLLLLAEKTCLQAEEFN